MLNFYQPSTENPPIANMDKTEDKEQPKVESEEVKAEATEEIKETEPVKTQEELEEEERQKKEADEEYLKPNWDESADKFDDMGLKEEVLRGIYGYGFNKPSPI